MSTINIKMIRQELEVFMRNSDIMSTTTRGVTTYTDNFVLAGTQSLFILEHQKGLKNVRSVEHNSSPLRRYIDYTTDYDEGKVTLLVSTAATDTVDIVYDSGEGDKIYTDYPRLDISLSSYPRIGFDDISQSNVEQALNAEMIKTDILISMIFYADKKATVLELWQTTRDLIMANKKSFHYFNFITLAGAGPMAPSAGRHDKIVQKNQDFRIPYEYETG